ncbi:MAG: DUF2911 domain-containing protein [Chitinophagaceae bacterium]|nr:DUF2911 domain-containing protein [Chitinophagaceae bacterium]
MKFIIAVFLLLLTIACANNEKATTRQEAVLPNPTGQVIDQTTNQPDTSKKSIKAYALGTINGDSIIINYYSPAVRNRIIWGGLVPLDQVWVTGAHAATSIQFQKNVSINNTSIAAGKYAFFTFPGKNEWQVILNKNWQQHLTDEYNQNDDVIRIKINVDSLPYVQERLRYTIEQAGDGKGLINMQWERIQLKVPFQVIK